MEQTQDLIRSVAPEASVNPLVITAFATWSASATLKLARIAACCIRYKRRANPAVTLPAQLQALPVTIRTVQIPHLNSAAGISPSVSSPRGHARKTCNSAQDPRAARNPRVRASRGARNGVIAYRPSG